MQYKELLQSATEQLMAANVPDAKTDAWRLFEAFTGFSRGEYFMKQNEEAILPDNRLSDFTNAVCERAKRVPLQYILGTQDFYGHVFKVSRDTLIPRFDTEIVVEKAIDEAKDYCKINGKSASELEILDVCTGTGCILISIVCELEAKCGVGTDISEGAIRLASENSELIGISDKTSFYAGDLFKALSNTGFETKKFDFVVSNPPYIKTEDIYALDDEVKLHEPMTALDGSDDGLLFYRRISKEIRSHIATGGRLVFEIGCDEASDVMKIMASEGFEDIKTYKDLAGLNRVVAGTYGGKNV